MATSSGQPKSKKQGNGGKIGSSQTLGSLLKHFEGIEIIVELKIGHRIRGLLTSADDCMNLILENPIQESPSPQYGGKICDGNDRDEPGKPSAVNGKGDYSSSISMGVEEGHQKEWHTILGNNEGKSSNSLQIRGSKIRYIHFPDNADLGGLVKSGVERERAAKNKYRRGKRK